MQILLANAKIMLSESAIEPQTVPVFQAVAEQLAAEMARMDTGELMQQLGCNRKIAAENQLRYRNFMAARRMPAVMAYNGQAYKHLKAWSLDRDSLAFAQSHLWITCFLYGLLRPMDGIVPYRMAHTVRLEATGDRPVSQYWKDRLTDVLIDSVKADDGILIHLSTAEYEHLFDWRRVCREVSVVQPLFYVRKGSGLKMQTVWAKACRGAMTRFIIENRLSSPSGLQMFSYEGFEFEPHLGEAAFPHFVRE
ncbi:MAG: YaaA family protein [Prevotella sp.]|nr:YaaA family protein [Prevotella sp.]